MRLHRWFTAQRYVLFICTEYWQRWFIVNMNNDPDSKIYGANMGPPGSCRPQMGPMVAPWTLLSGDGCFQAASMFWNSSGQDVSPSSRACFRRLPLFGGNVQKSGENSYIPNVVYGESGEHMMMHIQRVPCHCYPNIITCRLQICKSLGIIR